MADIAKCIGKGCDIRERCWRYLAPASKWQYYSNFNPINCEYFYEKTIYDEDTDTADLSVHSVKNKAT